MSTKVTKVTIPNVVVTSAEPPERTRVWVEKRAHGYAYGVTVCNDDIEAARTAAIAAFIALARDVVSIQATGRIN
jgi:hypothetical protein